VPSVRGHVISPVERYPRWRNATCLRRVAALLALHSEHLCCLPSFMHFTSRRHYQKVPSPHIALLVRSDCHLLRARILDQPLERGTPSTNTAVCENHAGITPDACRAIDCTMVSIDTFGSAGALEPDH